MRVRVLTATVLATTASQVQAQQLNAALRDTLTSDPQIAGATARVRAAEAAVDISWSARLPTLAVDGNAQVATNDTTYGPPRAGGLNVGLRFDLALYTGGEVPGRIRSSIAALDAEKAQRDALVNMRLADAADRYAGVYRDDRIEAARMSQVSNVETLLAATRARVRGGAATTTDTLQATARLAGAEAQLAEARATLTRSNEALRELTGRYLRATEDAEPPPVPARFVTRLSEQIGNVPTIRYADALVAMARADIQVARAERAPKLYLSSIAQAGDDFSQNFGTASTSRARLRIGFTLRMPLFGGGGPGARVRQAQQLLAQRQEDRIAAERQVVAQVRSQYAQLMALDATLPALLRAMDASRAALVGVQIQLKIGARSSLDVLNAQEEVTQAEIQYAQARQQRLSLAYALLSIMGELAPADFARRPRASAPPPLHTAMAAPSAAAKVDKLGLWVWKGSETWSLKAGRDAAQIA